MDSNVVAAEQQKYILAAKARYRHQDSDIQVRKWKVVKIRVQRKCKCGCRPHSISPGEFAVREKVLRDEQWGIAYTCLACLEAWPDHLADAIDHRWRDLWKKADESKAGGVNAD